MSHAVLIEDVRVNLVPVVCLSTHSLTERPLLRPTSLPCSLAFLADRVDVAYKWMAIGVVAFVSPLLPPCAISLFVPSLLTLLAPSLSVRSLFPCPHVPALSTSSVHPLRIHRQRTFAHSMPCSLHQPSIAPSAPSS